MVFPVWTVNPLGRGHLLGFFVFLFWYWVFSLIRLSSSSSTHEDLINSSGSQRSQVHVTRALDSNLGYGNAKWKVSSGYFMPILPLLCAGSTGHPDWGAKSLEKKRLQKVKRVSLHKAYSNSDNVNTSTIPRMKPKNCNIQKGSTSSFYKHGRSE